MRTLEKIDPGQLMLLVMFTVPSTIQLTLPRMLAKVAQESGWMSALLGSVLGFFVLALSALVALRLPPGPLPTALEALLGKFWGKAVCLFLAVCLFSYIPLMHRIFGTAINVGMMPFTPLSVLLIIFSINIFLLVYLGLETIARSAQAFFPVLLLFFLFVVIGALPLMSLQRLKPFFGNGLWPIIQGTSLVTPYFGEGVIVLALIPSLSDQKKAWRSIGLASFFIGLVFTDVTVASLAAFGATWTASVPYPVLRLARNVAIGRFIHRFEPFFMAVWYISVYIKTSLLVFLTGKLLAAVFNQENYRLLCAIILILAFPLAFLPPDQLSVFHLQFGFAKVVSIVVGVVLPLVLLPFTFKGGVQK